MQSSQRIIGLTGGIAMGKTLISDYLAKTHYLPVLDTDLYARDAVIPGAAVLDTITDRYGIGILLPNGTLNRQRLGEIIFNSSAERLWVEQCIHPYVRDRLMEAMQTSPLNDPDRSPIVIMVIPLLFEARMTDLVTEIWVVTCPRELQIRRLMARDRLSQEEAQIRIDSQMPIEKKIAHADVVLENSSTPEELFSQIDTALAQRPATKSAKG
jgi:dephospho-CoA kinase